MTPGESDEQRVLRLAATLSKLSDLVYQVDVYKIDRGAENRSLELRRAEPDISMITKALEAQDGRYVDLIGFASDKAQAMLVRHKDFIAIVFRGVDPIYHGWKAVRDWQRDFSTTLPKEDSELGSWQGSAQVAFASIWNDIREALVRWEEFRQIPIYLAGHGLGGALALICATRFNYKDWSFSYVFTFGAPRAATKEAAKSSGWGWRVNRYELSGDIVPLGPGGVYRHIGMRHHIDCHSKIQSQPQSPMRHLKDDVLRMLNRPIERVIRCHSIGRYHSTLERIWKVERRRPKTANR